MHLGFLLSMLISSFISEKTSQLAVLIIVGGLLSLLGAANLLFNRKIALPEAKKV